MVNKRISGTLEIMLFFILAVVLGIMPKPKIDDLVLDLEAELFGNDDHVFIPQGQAALAFEATDPEVLLSGPAGTGKTRNNLEMMHRDAMGYPGSRQLIVRKTRASLAQTVLVTYERDVMGYENPIVSGVQREYRKTYRYPNGSEIVIGGMDKPTKILSAEYDRIYVPEAIELTVTDFETLITRLRNNVMPYQQLLADTNPDSDQHWLYKRCQSGVTRMIQCYHEDNPVLFDRATGQWTKKGLEYVFGTLERLTGVRYLRLREGKWVQAEGAVYEDYNNSIHLIDRFEIPYRWRRIRSIDFGYQNPFTCGWWAISPDGDMYRYREIYMTHRLVEDHARQIVELSKGEVIEATVADHDAEDRATLERHGVRTIPAKKEIKAGIDAVQSRMRVDQVTKKPRIFIFRDALVEVDPALEEVEAPTCLADEIPGYVYQKKVDGKPNKELPVDKDNHGCDDMRYAVMYVDEPRPKSMQRAAAKGLFGQ